jgi:membrane protease YdiL (CAAX protease family)
MGEGMTVPDTNAVATGRPARRSVQLRSLGLLLGSYVIAAVLYLQMPEGMGPLPQSLEPPTQFAGWRGAATLAAVITCLYGAAGLAGWWLAVRAGLPGVTAAGITRRTWLRGSLLFGVAIGIGMVIVDGAVGLVLGWEGFPHPPFPASLLASLSAAIGEEIIFRLFLLTVWYVLLRRLLRWRLDTASADRWAAVGAIVIATLAFALGHLGTAMVLYGVETPSEVPILVMIMLLVLNAPVGIATGTAFLRVGLVGAVGVHLGANLIWHVLYGLLSG